MSGGGIAALVIFILLVVEGGVGYLVKSGKLPLPAFLQSTAVGRAAGVRIAESDAEFEIGVLRGGGGGGSGGGSRAYSQL